MSAWVCVSTECTVYCRNLIYGESVLVHQRSNVIHSLSIYFSFGVGLRIRCSSVCIRFNTIWSTAWTFSNWFLLQLIATLFNDSFRDSHILFASETQGSQELVSIVLYPLSTSAESRAVTSSADVRFQRLRPVSAGATLSSFYHQKGTKVIAAVAATSTDILHACPRHSVSLPFPPIPSPTFFHSLPLPFPHLE